MDAVTFTTEQVVQIMLYVIALVGVYFTMKAGVNGARKDIADIKKGVDELKADDKKQDALIGELGQGLAVLKSEVDSSKGWVRRIEETQDRLAGIVERRLAARNE